MTLAWSPDGRRIASGSLDSTVQVWDASSGKKLLTYGGHTDKVLSVAWSPDGRRIASGGRDRTVQVWDADTGKKILAYVAQSWIKSRLTQNSAVNVVAWSPDGKRIASGDGNTTVQVWNATDGSNPFAYKGHAYFVSAIAWSPDSKYIASGGYDKTVQVWDADTGKKLLTYGDHTDKVHVVIAWSPRGNLIASAAGYYNMHNPAETKRTGSEVVQVWDALTGNTVFTYHGHSGTVIAVAWSPDGKRIASAGFDKTVQVWQAL